MVMTIYLAPRAQKHGSVLDLITATQHFGDLPGIVYNLLELKGPAGMALTNGPKVNNNYKSFVFYRDNISDHLPVVLQIDIP
jgi:hypothetical protein